MCHGSQRALTLYTQQQTALLQCCDRYIRCQRSLAVKPLNSPPATYSQQVSVYWDGLGAVLDCGLWLAHHCFVYNYTTVVGYASGVVSCVAASLSAIIMSIHNCAKRDCGLCMFISDYTTVFFASVLWYCWIADRTRGSFYKLQCYGYKWI